jgi:hypothetical protein
MSGNSVGRFEPVARRQNSGSIVLLVSFDRKSYACHVVRRKAKNMIIVFLGTERDHCGRARQNQRRVRRSSLNKAVAAVVVLLGTAVTAAARQSAMPAHIVWKPIEIRSVVEFPKTADLYATFRRRRRIRALRSIATSNIGRLSSTCSTYSHRRQIQVRDRCWSSSMAGRSAHSAGSSFYDNIALWAVRHGFIGVTMSYRLAPQGALWRPDTGAR